MWAGIGLALCIVVGTAAGLKSKRAGSNFYESDVYGMSAGTHRRYVWMTLPFAVLFAASYAIARIPVVPLLAGYTVIAVFYLASFLRGYSDEF